MILDNLSGLSVAKSVLGWVGKRLDAFFTCLGGGLGISYIFVSLGYFNYLGYFGRALR